MDGPRAVRPDEISALRHLEDIVFRPHMPEQYPQLFNEGNLENLRVCFDGEVCISHVGMVQRNALIMGCQIRVCCIGAVATHPDFREKGLASLCFDDAVNKAFTDGVDLMIVSGGRGLYVRNGCLNLGRDQKYTVARDSFPAKPNVQVSISEWCETDLDAISECYRREPVRFMRPPDDYAFFRQSGWAMNAPSTILVIRGVASGVNLGAFLGYVVLRKSSPGSVTSIIEFSGDRHAVLQALPIIIDRYELSGLTLQVMGSDPLMSNLLNESGLEPVITSASGTIKIINFPQLMNRLRPRFAEIIGDVEASRLSFNFAGGNYHFGIGNDAVTLDRDSATRAVFGTIDGPPEDIAGLDSHLGRTLRKIFPVPTLWYGLNYV